MLQSPSSGLIVGHRRRALAPPQQQQGRPRPLPCRPLFSLAVPSGDSPDPIGPLGRACRSPGANAPVWLALTDRPASRHKVPSAALDLFPVLNPVAGGAPKVTAETQRQPLSSRVAPTQRTSIDNGSFNAFNAAAGGGSPLLAPSPPSALIDRHFMGKGSWVRFRVRTDTAQEIFNLPPPSATAQATRGPKPSDLSLASALGAPFRHPAFSDRTNHHRPLPSSSTVNPQSSPATSSHVLGIAGFGATLNNRGLTSAASDPAGVEASPSWVSGRGAGGEAVATRRRPQPLDDDFDPFPLQQPVDIPLVVEDGWCPAPQSSQEECNVLLRGTPRKESTPGIGTLGPKRPSFGRAS